ncbi:MAG: glycine--tRNA ligase [Bacilli bacterium]|jgi:glycyl-tRNA synthetase
MENKHQFDKIVNHLITYGFVYQGSEIYGGLSNTWDYGPLGVEVKTNIRNMWWKKFIQESPYNVGVDAAILMNPTVWKATGHLSTFNDPLIDCKVCKTRHRADNLIEDQFKDVNVSSMDINEIQEFMRTNRVKCPNCGSSDFTDIRQFNLMFKTHIGVTEDNQNVVYLRPETAQGIFTNFKNVLRTSRKKIPFGIGNVGKAFRNEITPGNFIFRTREFTQMELEFFCAPGTDEEWFKYWKDECISFVKNLGVKEEKLRFRDHDAKELSFYSKATTDIEYLFPFGWGEIWGIANRTDYDLKKHMEYSGENFEYLDPITRETYVPYCVEPSVGLDRLLLMVLSDSYDEEELEKDSRVIMHLHPAVAPYKAAVLPLTKKLADKAKEVFADLSKDYMIIYDETGSIGKRYRRNDAIGTPYCITIDFDTLEDESVTIRERDSMEQVRVKISELSAYLKDKVSF